MAGGSPFVRVIDNGVVHIRLFEQQSQAAAFAQIEKVRLGIERIVTRASQDGQAAPVRVDFGRAGATLGRGA